MVKIADEIYIVETKAEKDLDDKNVLSKRKATLDWVEKLNELNPDDRMGCKWHYILLGEKTFYSMSDKGASTKEILEYVKMSKSKIKGTLTRFISDSDDEF